MSGHRLNIIPRQTFDFTYLAAGASQTHVLAGKIPTARFTKAELLVRAHSVGIDSAGTDASITVDVVNDASTDEDPNRTFLGDTAIAGGYVTFTEATSGGAFELWPLTGDFGSMVAVRVIGLQSTGTAYSLVAEISADLILKEG